MDMQTLNPYILILQQQFYQIGDSISNIDPLYLKLIIVLLCIIIPFYIGRLYHDKKLTYLLDHINNQQTTRKYLSDDLSNSYKKIDKIKSKKILGIAVSAIIFMGIFIQIYQFQPAIFVDISIALFVALMWSFSISTLKYFEWKKKRLQLKLKSTTMTTEQQVKLILAEFGQQIEQGLRIRFNKQIENQRRREDNQQCKLYKCFNEKKVYNEIYQIYKEIISQLKRFPWCDICSSQSNINTAQLRLTEVQNIIKISARASIDSKITLEQRKQLVNRLLIEWTNLSKKITDICKRGCCLKFKHELDQIKNKYHNKIKVILSKLH